MTRGCLALLAAVSAWSWVQMASAQPALELRDAWVRALPPVQTTTAAYVTLVNAGTERLSIVSASSPVAERVEIHTTEEVDGMMRMRQLQALTLEPDSSRALTPGGTHLMLLGLKRMPAADETVELCLQLASGEEACTVAPALKAGPEDGAGAHQHHH